MKKTALILAFACSLGWSQAGKAISMQSNNAKTDRAIKSESQKNSLDQKSQEEKKFSDLVDTYFDNLLAFNPDWATELGDHRFDGELGSASLKTRTDEAQFLRKYLSKFEAIKPGQLSLTSQIDRELIRANLNGQLLELEKIKSWQRNPDHYSGQVTAAVHSLIKRDFAPLDERMKSAISRLRSVPRVLEEAKTNLLNPPKIYTEIALEQLPGMIDFFAKSVPDAFASVKNPQLQDELKEANAKAVDSLRSYQDYLQRTLLAKSKGNFALGSELYREKLKYDEMVDEPLDKLLSAGEAELKRLQHEFKDTAAKIDNKRSFSDVFVSIAKEHPAPDELLSSISGVLDEIRNFCKTKNIVRVPSDENLKVTAMPPFMTAIAFAALDCPGALEKNPKDSYYYATLPESSWSAEKTEEHMRSFCTYDLLNTSIHEAFPGHFLQGLFDRKAPSKTRKILSANSNVEGWAHYCEQMMVEEGFRDHDPKLKLAQIHDALLRVCRYIVGIKMHTQGMSMEEAEKLFVAEGFQEKANAERETKRGTVDPTYLVYTLGKLQIYDLRNKYAKEKGKDFSVAEFHNKFLEQGPIPVKLIERQILQAE